jgi:hypothetical protein
VDVFMEGSKQSPAAETAATFKSLRRRAGGWLRRAARYAKTLLSRLGEPKGIQLLPFD